MREKVSQVVQKMILPRKEDVNTKLFSPQTGLRTLEIRVHLPRHASSVNRN